MLHSTSRWVSLFLFHLAYYSFITDAGLSWSSGGPEFGDTEESVTVKEGETARLPCRVLHLKDRKVTWLRRRDLHILTTDHHTYSADERFKIVHEEGTDLWTLVVQYAQMRDSGTYECQVNADPKISRPVTLNVYGASPPISMRNTKVFIANNTASTKDGSFRVQIKGREIFMEEGSSLTLTCLVTSLYGPPTLIYWYHDTQLMDYNSPRGGIKMQMDHERRETTSRLTVRNVRTEDSGMYSCVPSGSHPATVRVHIHEGENKAAVQQGGLEESSSSSGGAGPCPSSFLPLLACACVFCLFVCRPQKLPLQPPGF
ncbi:opioid-binding protein/cell adhesion molecule-like [Macrobrachium rosenbergii]|uniref:opioid-binding protein/cell adhesion molecule-like n=1 Tax=Macrobrachium rosenbergii TaxID=79674 RepID=UPI0034D7788C